MKYPQILFVVSLLLLFACKKAEQNTSNNQNTPLVLGLMCKMNNQQFSSSNLIPEKLGWSHQLSSPQALSVWGKNDTAEILLYVASEQFKTGTFKIPEQARLRYTNKTGTIYPQSDSGEVVIQTYSNKQLKGTFYATHVLNDSTTQEFKEGTFYIQLP
jgi:hypothetical protein